MDVKFEPSEPDPREEEDQRQTPEHRTAGQNNNNAKKRRRPDGDDQRGDLNVKKEHVALGDLDESAADQSGYHALQLARYGEEGGDVHGGVNSQIQVCTA